MPYLHVSCSDYGPHSKHATTGVGPSFGGGCRLLRRQMKLVVAFMHLRMPMTARKKRCHSTKSKKHNPETALSPHTSFFAFCDVRLFRNRVVSSVVRLE